MKSLIKRELTAFITEAFQQFPVLTITGPRQSGKTTLARMAFPNLSYVNLENLETREFAREDPLAFLRTVPNGAILDEIQYVPELSSYIQEKVDKEEKNGLFVLTGSQQFNMLQTVSQSLAGRTAIVRLLPFSFKELAGKYSRLGDSTDDYLFRGFFPRLYDQRIDPELGLGSYIETYIERDLRQLSQTQNLSQFQKFLKLCAGRVGQILNFSNLADDVGINHKTASEWISLLEASYILFRLPPYYSNINKRLIKSPKLYFYDVGLAANLLGVEESRQIETHPLRGALFENMIVAELLKYRFNQGKSNNLSYFRDAKGHEVDLLFNLANTIVPMEIKSAGTFRNDFFKGLDYFHEQIQPSDKKIVIIDGDRHEERSRGWVTNKSRFTELLH